VRVRLGSTKDLVLPPSVQVQKPVILRVVMKKAREIERERERSRAEDVEIA
jgi:hypothetical protein